MLDIRVFFINGTYTVGEALGNQLDERAESIPDIPTKMEAEWIARQIRAAYRRGLADKASEISSALGVDRQSFLS